MNLLRHIQAVLWGFIGLGRRKDMSELHSSGNPILLIATGVVIARGERKRKAYTPEEVRDRLKARVKEAANA